MSNISKLIRTWILFSIISFFLYDIVWLLVDYNGLTYLIKNKQLLCVDICSCLFFSAMSLLFGIVAIRSIEKYKITTHTPTLWIIVLMINLGLVFLIEAIMPLSIRNLLIDDENKWVNAYTFGLIDPLLALVYIVDEYHKKNSLQKNENGRLRLLLLKKQLDPHFVFNSLSNLSGLIEIDANRAIQYVVRLSRIYRYFIRSIENDWSPLPDAISYAVNYVELIRERFPHISLVVNESRIDQDSYIASSSLLILLENAIKHNVSSAEHPLVISIHVRETHKLSVKNNLSEAPSSIILDSTHIGLDNLSKRTKMLCGRDITINKTETSFEVEIPIIKKTDLNDEKNIDYRRRRN